MSIHAKNLARWIACWLLPVFLVGAFQGQSNSHPAQTLQLLPGSSGGQYAATDVCQTCHQEVWDKHFAGTPHAALLKGDQHGCQACHGPGQAHVDGGGDITKIIRFETLSPAQTAAICTK
jgi:hypothetical protein